MFSNPKQLRAIIELGEQPQATVTCPRCGKGHLQAFEQKVGRQRFIHIWCSADEDHYRCVDGPREELFQGVPDLADRPEPDKKPKAA